MHLHHLRKKVLIVLFSSVLCFSGAAWANDASALWPKESQSVMEAGLCVTPTVVEGERPVGLTWEAAWWDEQCILLLASLREAGIENIAVSWEDGRTLGTASRVVVEPDRLLLGYYSSTFDPPNVENKGTLRLRLTAWLENETQPHTWIEALTLPERAWLPTRFLAQEAVSGLQTPDATIAGIRITPSRCTVIWQKKAHASITLYLTDAEGCFYPEVETHMGTYCETIFASPYFGKTPLTLSIQSESGVKAFKIPESLPHPQAK